MLRCRFDAASLSANQAALQDAHVSRRWLAAPTEELELVVERRLSAMDEAEAIAITIAFKHSHTPQRALQTVRTERTELGHARTHSKRGTFPGFRKSLLTDLPGLFPHSEWLHGH